MRIGHHLTIILWLLGTIAMGTTSIDSLNSYRISVGKYSEGGQLLSNNIWTIQVTDLTFFPRTKSIQINGFFIAQEGLSKISVQKDLHTVVFQLREDSASAFFSTSLVRGMLDQIMKNSTSVEEVVQKFLHVCETEPILYISGGEYLQLRLEYPLSISLSANTVYKEADIPLNIQWYSINGNPIDQHLLPKATALIKVSTFASGLKKVEKLFIN
jgi:hypothetical protein